MTSASILRADLLRQITTQTEVPIEQSFALTWLFSDASINHWCVKHGIQHELETCWVPKHIFNQKEPVGKNYVFLVFSKLPEPHIDDL